MKYRPLTKEQLEELHKEFAQFLAIQKIDFKEWKQLKTNKPRVAKEELAIFSDLVWDDVLSKTKYIEHISKNHMNLFKCFSNEMVRIYVKWNDSTKSFLNTEDFNWFVKNPFHSNIEYFKASKKYSKEKNQELFELIELGGQITKGTLFNVINRVIG